MSFKILDVDSFISEGGFRPIKNQRTFDKNLEPTPDGLQSKTIFGTSTDEKFTIYGYLNLEDVILHPLVFENLNLVDTIFNKVKTKKIKVDIADGKVIESETGGTGLTWIVANWKRINFEKYRNKRNFLFIDFLKNSKDNLILLNKIPIIPIGYRETFIGTGRIEENEIDALYRKIMSFSKDNRTDFTTAFLQSVEDKNKKDFIQQGVNEIYDFFIKKLHAKTGFVRNALLGKRLDSVGGCVANANPDVPIDCAIIPWHILINIFDIFVIAFLEDEDNIEIKKKLIVGERDIQQYGEFFDYIYRNSDIYIEHNPGHRELWLDILVAIFNKNPEIRCMIKRDPAWSANSYHCSKPIPNSSNSYAIIVNSYMYSPLGGDSFNSHFVLSKLFSNVIYNNDKYHIRSNNKKGTIIKTMNTIYRETTGKIINNKDQDGSEF